jgi:hypothetical protein
MPANSGNSLICEATRENGMKLATLLGIRDLAIGCSDALSQKRESFGRTRNKFSDGPETVSVEVSPLHHVIERPGVGALRVFRF